MTPEHSVDALRGAARPFLAGPIADQESDELARAVAHVALADDVCPHDVYRIACELLAHRMLRYGLRCAEPIACAEAMAKAWRKARRALEVAA